MDAFHDYRFRSKLIRPSPVWYVPSCQMYSLGRYPFVYDPCHDDMDEVRKRRRNPPNELCTPMLSSLPRAPKTQHTDRPCFFASRCGFVLPLFSATHIPRWDIFSYNKLGREATDVLCYKVSAVYLSCPTMTTGFPLGVRSAPQARVPGYHPQQAQVLLVHGLGHAHHLLRG